MIFKIPEPAADYTGIVIRCQVSVSFLDLPAFRITLLALTDSGGFTVTAHSSFFLPTLAVIVTLPTFFAVTTPLLLTLATALSELDHLTVLLVPLTFNFSVSTL